MPLSKSIAALQEISSQEVSRLLLRACQRLDKVWEEPPTPASPPVSPRSGLPTLCPPSLSPPCQEVVSWLSHLPDPVTEKVVSGTLALLERELLEDKDRKIIMTLFNIERMRVQDLSFGVHSLLTLLRGSRISQLHFSKRLWFCLWEYGEISGSKRLTDTLCSSLPGLASLTSLNLSHVANDRILYVISRYLPGLQTLDLTSSSVSDRGMKFLTGQHTAVFVQAGGGSGGSAGAVRNISRLLEQSKQQAQEEQERARSSVQGCLSLEVLGLQGCDCVTEIGLRGVLEALPLLKRVDYNKNSASVLEVLVKWASTLHPGQQRQLQLRDVKHEFPYSLSPPSEQMTCLGTLLPNLTSLTLVTTDTTAGELAVFRHLNTVTLELEDCLGSGMLSLLSTRGAAITSLSLSCSSDPDFSLLPPNQAEGATQGQLFNCALLAAGVFCPALMSLSISGCGLVSRAALELLEVTDRLGSRSWLSAQPWFSCLNSLLLMSYEETGQPGTTVNSGLLRTVLAKAVKLQVLNLEGNFGSFFTDQYVQDLLNSSYPSGPFSQLKVLDISVCDQGGVPGRLPLSMATVVELLRKCQYLRELRLSDWNISDQDYDELNQMVVRKNWDLCITRKLANQ